MSARAKIGPGLEALAIVALTVMVSRVVTYASGLKPSPVVMGIQTHHWMFGVGIFYLGLAKQSLPIASVGMGLVVDELDKVAAALYPSYPATSTALVRCG